MDARQLEARWTSLALELLYPLCRRRWSKISETVTERQNGQVPQTIEKYVNRKSDCGLMMEMKKLKGLRMTYFQL